MPTYEYHCEACRRRYELREGFDAPSSHPCQRCEEGTAVRVLHAPTVVFKGSGFYVNDSKKSSSSTTSSSDKTMSLPSADSGKSDSKSSGKGSGKSAKSSSSSSKD